jgi:hypothetical protein
MPFRCYSLAASVMAWSEEWGESEQRCWQSFPAFTQERARTSIISYKESKKQESRPDSLATRPTLSLSLSPSLFSWKAYKCFGTPKDKISYFNCLPCCVTADCGMVRFNEIWPTRALILCENRTWNINSSTVFLLQCLFMSLQSKQIEEWRLLGCYTVWLL